MEPQESDWLWKETAPGHWERATDEVERFYATLAKAHEACGRTCLAITGHVSITRKLPSDPTLVVIDEQQRLEDAVRKAWLWLRHYQPEIASWIEYDVELRRLKKVYEGFSAEESDSVLESDWLQSTFRAETESMTGFEFCNSDPPVPKLPTLFALRQPPTRARQEAGEAQQIRLDIVLRAHHAVIDGIGTFHLLNHLLERASDILAQGHDEYRAPRFGDEAARLNPPLWMALGLPYIPDPRVVALSKQIMAENETVSQGVEAAAMPFKRGALVPGKHQRVEVRLSPQTTSQILTACKALGCSVTHIYHAATAMQIGRLQPRTETQRTVRYMNYALLDLRSKCLPPYNSPARAASAYHRVSSRMLYVDLLVPAASNGDAENGPATVAATTSDSQTPNHHDSASLRTANDEESNRRRRDDPNSFPSILSQIKSYYLAMRQDQDVTALAPLSWASLVPPMDWHTYAHKPYTVNPPLWETPSVSISSMGVADALLPPRKSSFEVWNPFVTGEELGTGLGTFLGTYRGQIFFSAAYNDAFHEEAEVLEFVRECQRIILENLAIAPEEKSDNTIVDP